MRTLHHTIYYASRGTVFTLYHLTDLHVGARACAEELLKADIAAIAADPQALWIGGGDYIDAICQVGDRRYQPSALAKWALGEDDVMGVQIDHVVNLLAPIAEKCLGLVKGNHEWGAETFYARNVYWEIVLGLAAAAGKQPEQLALGAQGFVVSNFRRGDETKWGGSWRHVSYLHHGFGGGRLPGGHALAVGRVLGDYECDLALMGHRHTQVYLPKQVVATDGKSSGVTYRTRIGMFTPSYLESYVIPSGEKRPFDTYAEKIGLPPQQIGTCPIHIQPDIRQMSVVLSSVPGIRSTLVQRRGDMEMVH
jgi:hypothetical protein